MQKVDLATLTKEKRQRTKIRNKRGYHYSPDKLLKRLKNTTNNYAHKMDHLDKMYQFLESHNYQNLPKERQITGVVLYL